MTLKVCDLFCGIGGMTLAFQQAGFNSVFASEIDQAAADTFEVNFGHRPAGDIAGIDPRSVPDHDVCTIGLPCQGFSRLGRRAGLDDPREAVLYGALRLLNCKRPKVVVCENVANLVHHNGGRSLGFVVRWLRALRYRVTFQVLNATDFGGAQVRKRVFIVATRCRAFNFAGLQTAPASCIRDILDPSEEETWLDRDEFLLFDQPHVCPSGPVFAGYRPGKKLREVGGRLDRPATHRQYHRVYGIEGPTPTITNQSAVRNLIVLIDGQVRRLSVREWGRLQDFPDHFVWPRLGKAREQLGNSVHVPTVAALAREIREQVFGR